jgi:hypothetical protein
MPYPNNPNCETPFEVPLSLSHCPDARGTALASRWYFERLVRVIYIHKNHEQTKSRNDEWHVDSRAEELPNKVCLKRRVRQKVEQKAPKTRSG